MSLTGFTSLSALSKTDEWETSHWDALMLWLAMQVNTAHIPNKTMKKLPYDVPSDTQRTDLVNKLLTMIEDSLEKQTHQPEAATKAPSTLSLPLVVAEAWCDRDLKKRKARLMEANEEYDSALTAHRKKLKRETDSYERLIIQLRQSIDEAEKMHKATRGSLDKVKAEQLNFQRQQAEALPTENDEEARCDDTDSSQERELTPHKETEDVDEEESEDEEQEEGGGHKEEAMCLDELTTGENDMCKLYDIKLNNEQPEEVTDDKPPEKESQVAEDPTEPVLNEDEERAEFTPLSLDMDRNAALIDGEDHAPSLPLDTDLSRKCLEALKKTELVEMCRARDMTPSSGRDYFKKPQLIELLLGADPLTSNEPHKSDGRKHPVMATNVKEGKQKRFDSVVETARALRIKEYQIRNCCNNDTEVNGYTFKYSTA